MLDRRLDRESCLGVVCGIQDDHAGDGAHEGDVLVALVGRAVLANGDTGMGRADLDVVVRIAYRIAHLLEAASGGKHGEGGSERDLAAEGHTDSGGDHIVFRDTAVEEAIRERLLERTGLGGSGEVSVQNNEVRIDRAEFRQSLTVGFSCSNFISHNYCNPFS